MQIYSVYDNDPNIREDYFTGHFQSHSPLAKTNIGCLNMLYGMWFGAWGINDG